MNRFAVLLALGACNTTVPAESHSTTTTASGAARPVAVAAAADLVWTAPPGWTAEPAGGMRKASYRVAKVKGDSEDATATVIQAGGTVDENVARWKNQLEASHDFSRTDAKRDDIAITTVELHGTYTGGGVMVGESPNPRPGWALVGAIVTTPGVDQPYFFKMIGPDKTVAAARPDFQALVDSVHKK